jgi:hypothetical protein
LLFNETVFLYWKHFLLSDNVCSTNAEKLQINSCIQRLISSGTLFVRIIRQCSPNNAISCGRSNLRRFNVCTVRRSIDRRNLVTPRDQRCFRLGLSVATLDCLRRRSPRLRALLPLPPGPAGPVGWIPSQS